MSTIADAPIQSRQVGWQLLVKQCLDRCAAAAGLMATAPALLGSMAAVRLSMGAPVIFSQERPGRGGHRGWGRRLRH